MSLFSIDDLLNPSEAFDMLSSEFESFVFGEASGSSYDYTPKKKKKKKKKKYKVTKIPVYRVEPTERVEEYYPVSTTVYNSKTGQFETVETETNWFGDVPYGYNTRQPFNTYEPKHDSDDIENIVSSVIKDVESHNKNIKRNDIRNVTLTILFVTSEISLYQLVDHVDGDNHNDWSVELNSISKFLVEQKIFPNSDCYEINEFVSMQDIKDVIDSIDTKVDWTDNPFYNDIVEKLKKGYIDNKNREAEANNEEPVDETPILFRNSILKNFFVDDTNTPSIMPRINKNVMEYLVNKIGDILHDYPTFTYEIYPAMLTSGNADNISCRDTGQAIIRCTDNTSGYSNVYGIDLNNIVGNGYNIIAPSNFGGISQDIYINIHRHPELVAKILTTDYTFGFNMSNLSYMELRSVLEDQLAYPEIYKFFDFSDMSNHIMKLNNVTNVLFSNNLKSIINLPWHNIFGVGALMPRFRFRDYKDPSQFTIISDKYVRVQSEWMQMPFPNIARQFINTEEYSHINDNLVLYYDKGKITIYINGQEIKM